MSFQVINNECFAQNEMPLFYFNNVSVSAKGMMYIKNQLITEDVR